MPAFVVVVVVVVVVAVAVAVAVVAVVVVHLFLFVLVLVILMCFLSRSFTVIISFSFFMFCSPPAISTCCLEKNESNLTQASRLDLAHVECHGWRLWSSEWHSLGCLVDILLTPSCNAFSVQDNEGIFYFKVYIYMHTCRILPTYTWSLFTGDRIS